MTELIYDYIYTVLSAAIIMFCYCGFSDIIAATPGMYLAALLPAAVLTLFIHLRAKGKLLVLGTVLAVSAGIFLTYRYTYGLIGLSDHTRLVPFILISLISFTIGILTARMTLMKAALSISAVIFLLLTLFSYIRPVKPAIFSSMLLLIILITDLIQLSWKKEGFTDRRTHVVCTVPFLVFIVAVTALFHYPDKPYDWGIVKKAWRGVMDIAARIEFSIGAPSEYIIGFSDNGELITDLGQSCIDVLQLTVKSDMDTPVYLTGTVSDTFDGHRWTGTDISSIPERTLDAIESISSARSFSDELRDYYRESSISLMYLDTKTRYLFAPSKLTSAYSLSAGKTVTEQGADLIFPRYNPYHFSTNERYLLTNTGNQGFYEYMRNNTAPDEKQWKAALSTFRIKDSDKSYSYDSYNRYKQHIKKAYSENIPLSAEMKTRLNELYSGTESSYEKMKRLESCLQNMQYTLSPPPIPDYVNCSSDFLDHFLLESREGYCSYFATAFVLLARAEGLPARYVQGYRIPATKRGSYTVISAMAHAWPEVYFEGKGWIAFEPTPGFQKEPVWDMSGSTSASSGFSPHRETVFEPPHDEPVSKNEADGTPVLKSVRIYTVIVTIALLTAFFVLFIIISRFIQRRHFIRLNNTEKALYMAKDNLTLLHLLGSGMKTGETLSEYRSRIKNDVDSDSLAFIPIYEALLYSGSEGISAASLNEFVCCNKSLLNQLREKNHLKYFIRLLL